MTKEILTRPKTAAEVALRSESLERFSYHFQDWLHELKLATSGKELLDAVREDPRRLARLFKEGKCADAYLAAYVVFLCRRCKVPVPAWALKPNLRLKEPWYAFHTPKYKEFLEEKTPQAFKDKNVYAVPEFTVRIRRGRPTVPLAVQREKNALRQKRFRDKKNEELKRLRKIAKLAGTKLATLRSSAYGGRIR